jgi:hypothetical protein
MSERLERTVQVKLNAAGAGSVTTGPGRQGETWAVTRYSTAGASTVEPNLNVYRGAASLVDTTKHGNADVSENLTALTLAGGEFLTASYTGGTPNAVMTFYVEGTLTYAL